MIRPSFALMPVLLLAAFASPHAAIPAPTASSNVQEQQPSQPPVTAITPDIIQPVPPPSPTATAAELDKQAEDLRSNKLYVDAIEYYKAELQKDPKSWSAYNKMGIAQLQIQRFDEARKSFERSIKLNPKYADAYNNLGVIFYLKKNYGKAIKYYKKSIVQNEELASTHSNLGTAYFSRNEIAPAMQEYARALQLDPHVFENNSRTGVAMRLLSPADQAHYQYVIARLYAEMKDPDKCLNYLQKAIDEGYPKIKEVYKDEAFTEVRKDPRFVRMMARLEKSPQ